MFKILASWYRVFVYLIIICLITLVHALGSWELGLVIGLILSLFIELFSFMRKDTLEAIDKKMVFFDKTVKEQISRLDDFKVISEKLRAQNIEINTNVLNNMLDLYGTGIQDKMTPVFLFNPSVEPDILVHKPGVTVLFLNPSLSISFFLRLFDFVHKSYHATQFSKIDTWDFKPMEITAMDKQRELIKRNIEVKRIFIVGEGDKEEQEKVIRRGKLQKDKYEVSSRCITFERIKQKIPLRKIWEKYWSDFLNGQQLTRLSLLSPDFCIIDEEILVCYLIDQHRNHIGGSIFFKPYFLDQLIDYYSQLFQESDEIN